MRNICLMVILISLGMKSFAQATLPPTVTIPGGLTRLDDIGLYTVTYRYDDGRTGEMPLGWSGFFTEDTGIACLPFGSQDGKSAYLIHPIWRGGGTGDTDQTFRLLLPKAKHISLSFSIAMRKQDHLGKLQSDGVTFRLFLNNKKLLDQHKLHSIWSNFDYDLTPYSGKTITLRFEADPGPKRDPSYDYGIWGDREIAAAGGAPPLRPRFLPDAANLTATPSSFGGCSPSLPFHPTYTLQAAVSRSPDDLLQGWSLLMTSPSKNGPRMRPIQAAFGGYLELSGPDGKNVRSDSPEAHAVISQRALSDGTVERTAVYTVDGKTFQVHAIFSPPHGDTVKLQLIADAPYTAKVHFGSIGPAAFRWELIVPYLGSVAYFPQLGLYANVIGDYTLSHAGSYDSDTAIYPPLTNGIRNTMEETVYYSLSNNLRNVLPAPPNHPSPYRSVLGGLVVLDVWGDTFQNNAQWLRKLADYHITHLYTIAHNWQHGGYDNELPNTVPANAALGGSDGMRDWVDTAESLGERIALHENYVDFYPNAASFTWNDVARDSEGKPVPAWKNLIQSYALAPTAILKYAKEFTTQVQSLYHPNAGYLDVHSAVPPWFHVDYRSNEPGAGMFHTVFEAHKALWKLFRKVHNGPITGEGNEHWMWSGLLDGVEAQFGQGVPGSGGQSAPLFPDFDLLKIHPLQFNHGMGYLERWLSSGYSSGWFDNVPPLKTLDQYRTQEIIYGHDGFIPTQLMHSLSYDWDETNLLLPLTRRYAISPVVSVRYDVNGKLLDTDHAVAAGSDFQRAVVRYANGLTIYGNELAAPWRIGGVTLPQYGWMAKGDGVTAWTAERGTVVADYVQTHNRIYVNARTDLFPAETPLPIRPYIASFLQTGPRQFNIRFAFDIGARIQKGEQVFVHVTRPGDTDHEGIVFQLPCGIEQPPDQWPIGIGKVRGDMVPVTIPSDLKDGTYRIKVGIYQPQGGARLMLKGDEDGTGRIRVGTLTLSENGDKIQFQPDTLLQRGIPDSHSNPEGIKVDFGPVITNGSILMKRLKPGVWRLMPYPRDREFDVTLKSREIDAAWSKGISVEALGENSKKLGREELLRNASGGYTLQLNKVPGAVEYLIQNK